ncbi:hypothetical protein GCM10027019_03190 [Melaminivora jejuensis]|uniref:outer membrane lipoprotein LolB n=1 Tax=Melaminivora jejuensis TaxID=1267217 RepID=UPI001ADF98DE|nr:outer membrane lipoprotein LolB [Melaminivora jejuensis]UHJ65752.1 outer membrane lipoprotein LolB [Melaminivora jejuensis]
MSAALPPRRARRHCLALLAAGCGALLAGCAQPPHSAADAGRSDFWSGRLAVQVEESGDAAAQSFSAGFTLSGSASAGELRLFTPLGNALAELRWAPGHAALRSSDGERASPSLQQLTHELTGVDLPVEALFAWLHGDAVQVAGWQANLSRLGDGRLVAVRHTPAPQATLRLVLER